MLLPESHHLQLPFTEIFDFLSDDGADPLVFPLRFMIAVPPLFDLFHRFNVMCSLSDAFYIEVLFAQFIGTVQIACQRQMSAFQCLAESAGQQLSFQLLIGDFFIFTAHRLFRFSLKRICSDLTTKKNLYSLQIAPWITGTAEREEDTVTDGEVEVVVEGEGEGVVVAVAEDVAVADQMSASRGRMKDPVTVVTIVSLSISEKEEPDHLLAAEVVMVDSTEDTNPDTFGILHYKNGNIKRNGASMSSTSCIRIGN